MTDVLLSEKVGTRAGPGVYLLHRTHILRFRGVLGLLSEQRREVAQGYLRRIITPALAMLCRREWA
jgi:hypothetical protein